MIQRCPKCNQWCEAEKHGFIERAAKGFSAAQDVGKDAGAAVGSLLGKPGKVVGQVPGAMVGSAFGILNGALESFYGYKYQFTCPNCGEEWATDKDEDDQTDEYKREMHIVELRDKFTSIINAPQTEKQAYLNELQHELSDDSNTPEVIATLYDAIAATYQLLGEKNKALEAVDKSLERFDDVNTRVLKGFIMGQGRNAQDTYSAMREIVKYKTDGRPESPFISTPQIETELAKLQSSYSQNFLSIPVQQRKYLVICDTLTFLPESFRVLPLAEIPTNLKFPDGHHLQTNTLYVCHPYRDDLYYPYEQYENELLRDEFNEFKTIMEHLGARRIVYNDVFRNGEEQSRYQQRELHGSGDYGGQYSGGFAYEKEGNSAQSRATLSAKQSVEEFEMAGRPALPRDLVWYGHRKEWQDKCQSRLEGRLIHYEFTLSTSNSEMTSESERQKIEFDLNILITSVKGGAERNKSINLKKEEEKTVKVDVYFYPLSDYDKKEIAANNVLPTSAANLPIPFKKKINVFWIMGTLIVALILVILGLLFL